MNKHVYKEDMQMANRQLKRCSTLPIIRKGLIQTTVEHHFIATEMALIKKTNKQTKQVLARIWRNWNPCASLVGL